MRLHCAKNRNDKIGTRNTRKRRFGGHGLADSPERKRPDRTFGSHRPDAGLLPRPRGTACLACPGSVSAVPGLTPTAVSQKLAEIKMIDVWIPTVDQRWLVLPRYAKLSLDTKLLIEKLKLQLSSQPPPRRVAQKQSHEIEVPTVR
jgi:hypothetical protein